MQDINLTSFSTLQNFSWDSTFWNLKSEKISSDSDVMLLTDVYQTKIASIKIGKIKSEATKAYLTNNMTRYLKTACDI